ncbi:MAG: hypothetical protein P8Y60_15890, partial [Calditrichota bacterium]
MDVYQFLADYAAGQNKYDEARQLYLQAASFAAADSQSVSLKIKAADMLFDNGEYATSAKELKALSQNLTGQKKYSIWEKAVVAYVRGGDVRTANSEMKALSKAARYKEDALPVLRYQYERSKVLAANKRLDDSQEILTEILSHDLPEDFKTQVQYEMARQMVIANKYHKSISLWGPSWWSYSNPGRPFRLSGIPWKREPPASTNKLL